MQLTNEHYANQKLSTQWGAIQADATGTVVVTDKEAIKFFKERLRFAAQDHKMTESKPEADVLVEAASQPPTDTTTDATEVEEEKPAAPKTRWSRSRA